MIPWYQQGSVNVHAFAQPNYVIPHNLFGTDSSLPSTSYYQSFQESSSNPTPYFQIEAQVYHHPNLRAHEAEDLPDDRGQERNHNELTKPRVFPIERFEPKQDAITLNKAMMGHGTRESQIIKIITKRSLEQRLVIAEIYKEMFGSDLLNDLRRETSGNFRRLLLALMTPLYQFYARELRDAMAGPGTNEDILIEVLCTLSNLELEQVKKAYHNMFRTHLEEHIRDETSGHFKELLISLTDRTDDYDINSLKAKEQARRLHRAGELRMGTDESEFISILSTQSFVQLNEIFYQYQAMTQHDIDDVIVSEFSGDLKKALRTIVKVARNKPLYFAECLYNAIKRIGTNDRKLIRIMVTRGELDLGDIAEAFRMKYGTKLEVYVKSDTSGDYRRALLSLLDMPLHPTSRYFHDLFLHETASHTETAKGSNHSQSNNVIIEKLTSATAVTQRYRKRKGKKKERGRGKDHEEGTNYIPSLLLSESHDNVPHSKDSWKNSNSTKVYGQKNRPSTAPTIVVTGKVAKRKHKKVKKKKKGKKNKPWKKSKNATSHINKTITKTRSTIVIKPYINDMSDYVDF